MNLKRNMLSAAVLSTLVLSGTAGAVHLSETGTGEVLLYPYYTVRSEGGNAYNTYIHITNTTASAKAVKVRFREAKNSREVLDFNLYLSPYDEWAGTVEPTTDGAKIVAHDNSCTVPAIPAAGEPFRNYGYVNIAGFANSADGAGTSLDRTREGYIEVIEMGNVEHVLLVDGTSYFDTAVTHKVGLEPDVPNNCQAVVDSWKGTDNIGTGSHFDTIQNELLSPTGGIFGSGVLINVGNGAAFANEPVVLDDWWDYDGVNPAAAIHAYPGTESPTIGLADPVSFIFSGTGVVGSDWDHVSLRGYDAVSAVLMRDSVMNEYTINPGTFADTDWVVTFPTKRAYVTPVAVQDNDAMRPFTKNFVTRDADGNSTSTDAIGACEDVTMKYWDREEQTPTTGGGVDFSPSLPGAPGPQLCWEANVISFKSSAETGAHVGILGSTLARDVSVDVGEFPNGWMKLIFSSDNAADNGAGTTLMSAAADADGVDTYFGLPVIGYAVKSISNDSTATGTLSNYGSTMIHKYSRDLVDDLPLEVAPQ